MAWEKENMGGLQRVCLRERERGGEHRHPAHSFFSSWLPSRRPYRRPRRLHKMVNHTFEVPPQGAVLGPSCLHLHADDPLVRSHLIGHEPQWVADLAAVPPALTLVFKKLYRGVKERDVRNNLLSRMVVTRTQSPSRRYMTERVQMPTRHQKE